MHRLSPLAPKTYLYVSVVSLLLPLTSNPQLAGQTNIIQIVADDMGWSDLSSGLTNYGLGSTYYQTPNIDSLALGGMSFTSAYAQPTCTPTRTALFTGQYATLNGVYTVGSLNGGGANTPLVAFETSRAIASSAITIGETLQLAGYHTCHIGKFHCTESSDDIVDEHGFTQNIGGTTSGGPNGNVPYFAEQNNRGNWVFASAHGPELDPYAEPYTEAYINANLLPYANGNDPSGLAGTPKHLNDAMADATIDYLEDRISDGQPFFVNVAFNAVHNEIHARPDLQTKYDGLTPSSLPQHDDATYAGLLEGMDQAIGRIVDFVHENGLSNNTLIVFMSDNGGSNVTDAFPLSGGKGSFLEGGVRVPLIAYLPGQIAAGGVTDVATHSVDLYPTYAELANATLPDPVQHPLSGESLVGILTGSETQLERSSIFYHFPGYTGSTAPFTTIIHDGFDGNRYKLNYLYESRNFELYDLTNDIDESDELLDAGLTPNQFAIALTASGEMIDWLLGNEAIYLTERSTGEPVPPPHHSPWVELGLGSDALGGNLDGSESGAVTQHDIDLNLEAAGSSAVFRTDSGGIGINSALDSGGPNVRRRIDGSLATPEGIIFSFDQDVFLKELRVLAFSGMNAETIHLSFESGVNPFPNAVGYDSNGFSNDGNTLSYSHADNINNAFTLRFGQLTQGEILIPAGTRVQLSTSPATDGGVLLASISVALPYEIEVKPTSAQFTRGNYRSGGETDLFESDNQDLVGQRRDSDLQSRVELEVDGVSQIATPSSLSVRLESAVFARSPVNQTIEFFNFDSSLWETISQDVANRIVDRTVVAEAGGDLRRFVETGTGAIKARVRYESDNPRQQFSANVDQFIWQMN